VFELAQVLQVIRSLGVQVFSTGIPITTGRFQESIV